MLFLRGIFVKQSDFYSERTEFVSESFSLGLLSVSLFVSVTIKDVEFQAFDLNIHPGLLAFCRGENSVLMCQVQTRH